MPEFKFKLSPMDTIDGIEKAVGFYIAGFEGLLHLKDSQTTVANYRPKIERVMQATDQAMTLLILAQKDNDGLLVNWAARMGSCKRMLDALDRNLAFMGKTQWSWDEVIQAMAYLEAVTKGAKLTLWDSGVDF